MEKYWLTVIVVLINRLKNIEIRKYVSLEAPAQSTCECGESTNSAFLVLVIKVLELPLSLKFPST